MYVARLLAGALAMAAPVTALVAQQDWSRFRGPNGSGVHAGPSALARIAADSKPAWRVEVPFARSSPVVAGDLVVLTASDEHGLIVHAVRTNGESAWSHTFERARTDDRYKGNDSASPSPVADGEAVYAFFPELGLVAIGLDGKLRWRHDLAAFDSFYGMSSSPILAGNRLFLQCDQESGSHVLAVDKGSGEMAWRAKRPGVDPSWTTPVIQTVDGEPANLVLFSSLKVTALAIADGREAWTLAPVGTGPVCSPVIDGDRLYVSVSYHGDQPLPDFATLAATYDADKDGRITKAEVGESEMGDHFGWVDDDEDGAIVETEWNVARSMMLNRDHGLVAFDISDPKAHRELWRNRRSLPELPTPLVYGDIVYTIRNGGVLTALDAVTGKVHKRGRIDVVEEFYASPIAADGKLCLASHDGKLVTVNVGKEWTVASVLDLDERIEATPALGADGSLFVRTAKALYCFR